MPQIHNAVHRLVALQAAYKAALGEVGADFNGIERAGETLTPVIDLWSLPEWTILRGARRYGAVAVIAASGAAGASVRFRNPIGSILVVVESLIVSFGGTSDELQIRTSGQVTDFTTLASPSPIDSRIPTNAAWARLSEQVTAPVGGLVYQHNLGVEDLHRVEIPFVLAPGSSIDVSRPDVAATDVLHTSWVWTERLALPGELE